MLLVIGVADRLPAREAPWDVYVMAWLSTRRSCNPARSSRERGRVAAQGTMRFTLSFVHVHVDEEADGGASPSTLPSEWGLHEGCAAVGERALPRLPERFACLRCSSSIGCTYIHMVISRAIASEELVPRLES